MATLYSYCLPHDDGAAPNPFWGLCTLVICKPAIRRVATTGDWIVGTGSALHNLQNRVIYAMEVTAKLTLAEYDAFCLASMPGKIPSEGNAGYKNRIGDCIYDYSTSPATLRASVHDGGNRKTDASGQYALLSNHFYYFGDHPIQVPAPLLPVVRQGPGHKSISINNHLPPFVEWITGTHSTARNKVLHEPYLRHWHA
jgi:hypothetical protein